MGRKTITREMFVGNVNANLFKEATHYGKPATDNGGVVDYEDLTASRVLMNLFNDYRGFKIMTLGNGATYAHYH